MIPVLLFLPRSKRTGKHRWDGDEPRGCGADDSITHSTAFQAPSVLSQLQFSACTLITPEGVVHTNLPDHNPWSFTFAFLSLSGAHVFYRVVDAVRGRGCVHIDLNRAPAFIDRGLFPR